MRVQIRADHIGDKAVGQRLYRDPVVEAAAAVPHIKEHAPLPRFPHLRHHRPRIVHHAVARALITMGHHIAGPQQGEHIHNRHPPGDVYHHRHPRPLGRLHRQLQGLSPILADLETALPHLDADAVLLPVVGHKRRALWIAVLQIDHLPHRPTGQTNRRNMHEPQNLGPRRLDHIIDKPLEVGPPRASSIDDRRHARGQAQRIAANAPSRASRVEVRVDIDPTRRQDFAGQVNRLRRWSRNFLGHCGDLLPDDSHVADSIHALCWVHHSRPF